MFLFVLILNKFNSIKLLLYDEMNCISTDRKKINLNNLILINTSKLFLILFSHLLIKIQLKMKILLYSMYTYLIFIFTSCVT